jgi:hypothetical protein
MQFHISSINCNHPENHSNADERQAVRNLYSGQVDMYNPWWVIKTALVIKGSKNQKNSAEDYPLYA